MMWTQATGNHPVWEIIGNHTGVYNAFSPLLNIPPPPNKEPRDLLSDDYSAKFIVRKQIPSSM
jgi:hypothetical protein